ncbi:hypothetical protein Tco_0420560 [Tanacetum coccineum]
MFDFDSEVEESPWRGDFKKLFQKKRKFRKTTKMMKESVSVQISLKLHQRALLEDMGVVSREDEEEKKLIDEKCFMAKALMIESARATPKAHLPYGMFLTRLFRHVMELYPHLDNGIYNVVQRVMRPLALRQTRRPRSDRGKARRSVSLTFAHHNRGSSSHQGDDDEDDGASRASTLSPTTYLNSLGPLDYQPYDIPTSSEQNDDLLFERIARGLQQEKEVKMLCDN